MKTINRAEIKGIIGQEPRVNTVGGRTVANFSVATENTWKDQNGEWQKETDWHNVCAWDGYGIAKADALHSGTKVHIIGRLRTRKYTNNQGLDQYVTEVLAEELDIIYEPSQTQSQPQNGNYTRSASPRRAAVSTGGSDDDF